MSQQASRAEYGREPIERVVREWNERIRDAVYAATGLLPPPAGKKGVGVVVEVSDEEKHYKSSDATHGAIIDKYKRLLDGREDLRKSTKDDWGEVKKLMKKGDVLGEYNPRERKIHLFWPMIQIGCLHMPAKVEALTAVVLAHEWAHAVTHVGQDADGHEWDTACFESGRKCLIEGLAQYYCRKAIACLDSGEWIHAFETLLSYQPAEYKGHEQIEDFTKHGSFQERVRSTLVHFRNTPEWILTLDRFVQDVRVCPWFDSSSIIAHLDSQERCEDIRYIGKPSPEQQKIAIPHNPYLVIDIWESLCPEIKEEYHYIREMHKIGILGNSLVNDNEDDN